VARGLALLFGIGTTALPSWDSRIRWGQSLPRPCRKMNGRPKRTYELTSSIVPRGTSLHRWQAAGGRAAPRPVPAPLAFAAVLAALEPSPASLRLDDNILDRRFVDAVALEPPARHARGEDMKCAIGRGRHLDALADGGNGDGPVHFPSLS